jgi:hypothetical protein
MAENERAITTYFRADISDFSASTQQLNRYIKTVNSEFANATAGMGKWSDNADGLTAKLMQLNGILEAQKRKLASLEEEYADLVAQGKGNTKEAQALTIQINQQSAAVKKTEKDIEGYSESLEELKGKGVKTREELEKLKKTNEDLKSSAKELGGNVLKGMAVGLAGVAAAAVGALKGLSSIVEETKELRTQMGQIETGFTTAGLSAKDAEKTYGELFSVLGDSGKATEASMHLGQLAKSEQELEDYTNVLTGVYATFGDSLPIEGLAEAINHTAKLSGESAAVQGVLADALEWGGVNVDEFNEKLQGLNTEEERSQLISETLNGIYGDTATAYKEVNKDVIAANEAQNSYNQAMADIGEKAQPIITSFKTSMVEVLQTVLAKFNEVDIAGLVGKISEAIQVLVTTVLPPLMSAVTWILNNLNWLAPLLGTVIGLIGGIAAGIKIYNGVVQIAKTVQLAWNLAMSANPIGIVITAIGLLVAAFVTLWNKCEGFRNFWLNMWEGIKTAAKAAADFIGGIFSTIMNTIKGVINGVISVINGAIGAINKISVTVPDWVPEFGGKKFGFNIPKIPMLAEGGVVSKPTLAMVGEAGKEAVLPLEENTAWIDKLAEKLAGKVMPSQTTTNNFNYTFKGLETSKLALHKAQLETKRIVGGK